VQPGKVDTDKKQHPTPASPPDKAMVYVIRPTGMGGKIQTKLAVDGKPSVTWPSRPRRSRH
jgi:hypothetical protein